MEDSLIGQKAYATHARFFLDTSHYSSPPAGGSQPQTRGLRTMRSFLLLASLISGAAALRQDPRGAFSLASRLATHPEASDSGAQNVDGPAMHALWSSSLLLSEKCTAAYDILNNDQGYLDAVSLVFDDARMVGKATAEACTRHLKPCANPLGGTCTEDAQKFWTEDLLSDVPELERACAKVLPEDELAPVMWLSEYLVTNSPLSYLPFLGIELKLPRILPVYVPASCRNDADEGMILAYFSDACAREEKKQLKQCKFSIAKGEEASV